MDIIDRFFQHSKQSYFLFGPRGTGKSTWIHRHLPNSFVIDLLAPDVYRIYSARPERLREVLEAQHHINTVVIDEIQKAPQLLDVVHYLMEEHRSWQFILTGSSARKLKRAGVDLLAGRALLKTMHPFMAAELGDKFSLQNALTMGMVPLIVNAHDPAETLKAYAALYIREEVQMEGLVRNIGDFNRFLEAASFSHGSVINMTEIAKRAGVSQPTVSRILNNKEKVTKISHQRILEIFPPDRMLLGVQTLVRSDLQCNRWNG